MKVVQDDMKKKVKCYDGSISGPLTSWRVLLMCFRLFPTLGVAQGDEVKATKVQKY